MWRLFAFGSAFFAGITAVLAKCGIKDVDSDAATAVRTVVVQALLLKLLNKTIIKPHRHVVYGVCLFLYSMLKIIID